MSQFGRKTKGILLEKGVDRDTLKLEHFFQMNMRYFQKVICFPHAIFWTLYREMPKEMKTSQVSTLQLKGGSPSCPGTSPSSAIKALVGT